LPSSGRRSSGSASSRSSAAAAAAGRLLGVVLTGMGSDGLEGSRVIRKAGGIILAQDSATSVIWGMPGVVAQAGLAARVLPLTALPAEILRLATARPASRSAVAV